MDELDASAAFARMEERLSPGAFATTNPARLDITKTAPMGL